MIDGGSQARQRASRSLEMTLHEAVPAPSDEARAPARRLALAGPYPWIGFAGAVIIATTTPLWRLDRRTWRITLPGLPHDGQRPTTAILFVTGLILLALAWIGLVSRVEHSRLTDRERTRAVLLTCALWFAPILLGPPLLSSDVYSYGAQGEMVTRGLDPTAVPMYKLLYGDYVAMTDQTWRTPVARGDQSEGSGNPYGPVQMGLAATLVTVSGHNPAITAFLFKVVAAAFLALAAWGISDIARRHGVSPPVAVALAVANPIAVIHIVGGGHNDGVMLGLLCAGVALAMRDRWRLGIVLISCAALVKLPAAAGIVFLAWNRPGVGTAIRARLRSVLGALAIGAAVTAVACLTVGIGLGWIGAMRQTGSTKGTLSVMTQLGYVVSHAISFVGFKATEDTWVNIFRFLGLGVAGLASVALLWRSPKIGAVRALGLCLLAVMLLGPVVWPWYLAPVFAVLFAAGIGRWRPSAIVLCSVFAGEVLPSGVNGRPVLERQHLVNLLLIGAIGLIAFASPWIVEWWKSFRPEETDGTAPTVALAD